MTDIGEMKRKVSLVNFASGKTRLEKRSDGSWWGCCPIHGERTASLKIEVKKGEEVYYCHGGCKEGGDILTFIEKSEKLSKSKAIERLKELAGIAGPKRDYIQQAEQVTHTFYGLLDGATGSSKKTMPVQKWTVFEKLLGKNPQIFQWLAQERGITQETAQKLRFGYDGNGHVLLPRISGDKVLTYKYRSIKEKSFFYAKDMDSRNLFNLDTIDPFEPVFVTEGEFDAAILEQCGYRAVSMPSAGIKLLPDAKKALKQADCIYLAGDNDGGVGNAYMKQLARELGENTYLIVWPGAKDANDFFLKICGRDETLFREKVEELKTKAQKTPVEGFSSILDRLRNLEGTDMKNDPTRLYFPWPEVDAMNYSPRGSIVVFFSTYSGTGKTVFATQVAMHEAKRGETVVVYSPELRDENYLALLAAQWLGAERDGGLDRAGKITGDDYKRTAEILEMTYPASMGGPPEPRPIQYYVGFSLPEIETEKIIEFIEFTIKVTGATRFVIDTLHRIISTSGKESLTDLEGKVIKRLEAIGNKYGTIFILIGQSNKEAEGLKEKNRDERGVLRGSRELQDVSYGIYLIHRSKMPKDRGNDQNLLSPETELSLVKDRGKGPGGFVVPMLYRRDCSRFVVRETRLSEPETPQNDVESSIF